MAAEASAKDDGTQEIWEGYSDFRDVSKRIGQKVSDAIRAYSILQSAMKEQGSLSNREVFEARSKILEAAMSLIVEVRHEARNNVKPFHEIEDRWTGDDGFINRFHEWSARDGVPGWVYQFVVDIRTAAWELGYLQAGRREEKADDPVKEDIDEMFPELV